MSKFILIFSLCVLSTSFASEVDSFTNRQQVLNQRDATEEISAKINWYIDLVVRRFNKKNNCSVKPASKLYKLTDSARSCLGGHWRNQCKGEITLYRWLKYRKYGGYFDRSQLHPKKSVYRDFKFTKSPSLTLVSTFHNTMGVTVNLQGHLIGTDKFSHFFNRGRKYWKNYYGYGKNAKKITRNYANDPLAASLAREKYMLAMGKYSEESLFGAKSTGVASYGDLAANFAGLRFWNDFTGLENDIITGRPVSEPYIKCVGTSFVINKKVDIKQYLNVAWDEGQNCSVYQTRKMALQVQRRVSNLPASESLHCPINIEKLRTAKDYYGKFYAEVVKEIPYQGLPKGIKSPKPFHFYKTFEINEANATSETTTIFHDISDDDEDEDEDEDEDDFFFDGVSDSEASDDFDEYDILDF